MNALLARAAHTNEGLPVTTRTISVNDRALAFLSVERGEERTVGLMAAHSFFMGCATVFFETAASATFLSRFDSSYLPWVYVAAAGVNTITGTVYSNVQRRLSFASLMKGTLWFLIAMIVAVRVGLAVSTVGWIAFAGLVSYRVVSSLTDLEYWAVASRIYDVRQAKRLFGLIGTGEVIARIAGSLSIPLLVRIGGVRSLMVLSASALCLCALLLGRILRRYAGAHERPRIASSADSATTTTTRQPKATSIRDVFTNPYLAIVVGVAILATFGKYFVDFAFLEQLSTVSKGEEQIATFLGLFNGLTQTLSLLTRLFISRPLLHRFGIRVGVLILPIAHAICSAATLVAGYLHVGAVVIFWFVLANQGIYKTLKHPIDNASFKVLYQPLTTEQRLAAQIAVEVIFSPVVVGVAGGIMLLFTTGIPYNPVLFAFVLLANFLLWTFLARKAGRAYAAKLLDMLRRRIEGNVVLPFDDATTLSVLRSRLTNSDAPADEICAALYLIERAEAPDLTNILVSVVVHRFAEVRRYAVERLVDIDPSALRPLRLRISNDSDPSVRASVLKAIGSEGEPRIEDVASFLTDSDHLVRRTAVAVLFATKDDKARAVAKAAIDTFKTSDLSTDRALAARLAGDHGIRDVVQSLIVDADPDVRRAALMAAGHFADWPLSTFLEPLREPRFALAAASALALRGRQTIADLELLFVPDADRLLLRRIVFVYRLVGEREASAATEVLSRHIGFDDLLVRSRVIAALDRLRWSAQGSVKNERVVRDLIIEEAREAAWTLQAMKDFGSEKSPSPALAALCSSLQSDIESASRRVLTMLSFVHDRVAIKRVAAHLEHRQNEKRAYAHEALELVLDEDDRTIIVAMIERVPPQDRGERLHERFPQGVMSIDDRIRALLRRSDRFTRSFTRALVVRLAIERNIPARKSKISASASQSAPLDPMVTELMDESPSLSKERPMLLIEKVILLKTVQMFSATAEELLTEIATLLEDISYPSGATIFEKGDKGDSMYIVIDGRVRVFDEGTTLSLLGEKEIFGELALLDPEPRSASVEAVEATRVFRLDGDAFAQLMAGNLDIVRGVLHVLCQRLRRTSASASASKARSHL